MLKSTLILSFIALATCATIDPSLKTTLNSKGMANIFVSFKVGTSQALEDFAQLHFESRDAKLDALAQTLQSHATSVQRNVLQLVQTYDFKSFWVNNQIFVRNADASLVDKLSQQPEIDEIIEEEIFEIDMPVAEEGIPSQSFANEWNIEKIEAPKAWEAGNTGKGIRVATIDTGVLQSHEALAHNFYGAYGWFDPYQGTAAPNDQNGHGTHTTGTIAGSHGIGVAPDAKWLACKGCATFFCTQEALIACGQFMTCPTLPDGSNEQCSHAPHLVSNSWGGGQGRPMFNGVIEAWEAAGIIPLFSNGNSGPRCGSANSPADNPRVIAVGSTTNTDALSSFSSVGPSVYGSIKPDVSAPGSAVKSSYNSADNAYEILSGTSMACPHVAGLVALLKETDASLTFDEVREILVKGAEKNLPSDGKSCDGIGDNVFPNHHFGNGRINAARSVQAL